MIYLTGALFLLGAFSFRYLNAKVDAVNDRAAQAHEEIDVLYAKMERIEYLKRVK